MLASLNHERNRSLPVSSLIVCFAFGTSRSRRGDGL